MRQDSLAASLNRISALILRYWYLMRASWPRMLDLVYWPIAFMVLWGFTQKFVMSQSGFFAGAFGLLLAGVMLWDVMFRGQLGLSISFFEEVWSRNVGHLMVSPMRDWEWIAALMAISGLRTVIGTTPAALLAIWFFGFNVYDLGFAYVLYFVLLIVFGWAVGLFVSGLVLRHGMGAESLAWALMFGIAPIACIYYPLSVLPEWLQWVAICLPPVHVFEGMRTILIEGRVDWGQAAIAAALDLVALAVGIWSFLRWMAAARDRAVAGGSSTRARRTATASLRVAPRRGTRRSSATPW